MQVLTLEEEFGESLEDEVCNAKRHSYFAFHFTVCFFYLFLPLKHFVQELINRTRQVFSCIRKIPFGIRKTT